MMPVMFGAMAERSQFVNAVYPHNMTPEGQEKHRQTFLFLKGIDPSQRWLKATDNATGEIVGVAQWNVFDGPKPPEIELDGPPGTWDTQDDKEWAQALFRAYMEDRRKVIREATGPVMCTSAEQIISPVGEDPSAELTLRIGLTIMTVAPHYQYRGVGTALTKWGTDLADEIGAEVCSGQSQCGRNP